MDFHGHPFWWLVTLGVVVWYSTITIYVAVKGTLDIKDMLRTLRARETPATHDTRTNDP
jgi:hypothetical protein